MVAEEYKIASELMEKESDRYWNRSNIMLVIQGALIALYGGVYEKGLIVSLAVAIQGMIFTFFWYWIVVKGCAYVKRWDSVIEKIEVSEKKKDNSFYALRHMNDAARINDEPAMIKASTTKIMKMIIVSVMLFWLAMSLNAVFSGENNKVEKTECEIKNGLIHIKETPID